MKKHIPQTIGIIGNGSWGTALAKILTDNGIQIRWWLRNEAAVQHLKERHHNPNYLSSVAFRPGTLLPSSDLNEVLEGSDTLVFSVPSAYAAGVLETAAPVWKDKWIISAVKGIIPGSNLLLHEHLSRFFGCDTARYAAITGPCHAEEVARERVSYLTFSGTHGEFVRAAADAFTNHYIHTTCNGDIWGTQYAAVLKNIYALGAGIAHALDYGDNFLSVYATNCYGEMYRFLREHYTKECPGRELPDFHTSAYLGDLLVTCYSLHSRNRTFGNMIGKGYSVQSATLEMNMVAEGYYASKGMYGICAQLGISLPVARAVYSILWEQQSPAAVFTALERSFS